MRLRFARGAAFALCFVLAFVFLVLLLSPVAHPPTRQAVIQAVADYNPLKHGFRGSHGRARHGYHGGRLRPPTPEQEWEYRRALVYEGTGARVRRFLRLAQSGQPWTMAVIGGSVSKGRGLVPPAGRWRRPGDRYEIEEEGETGTTGSTGLDPVDSDSELAYGAYTLYSPENLHVQVFEWLNETYPHPQNRLINGAQGGVGAGYFGWCFREHIPEDSDLVLVELGIQDLVRLDIFGKYEQLVRGLLEMPSRPAIINLETFSTLFPSLLSASTLHHDTDMFYDIPSLSIRDTLLPRILSHPNEELPKWFRTGDDVSLGDNKVKEYGGLAVDLMHISAVGHTFIAGLIIRYLSEQTKTLHRPGLDDLVELPNVALTSHFAMSVKISRHNPQCRTMNSARRHPPVSPFGALETPSVQGMRLAPQSKGWARWHWEEKTYLVATEPGSLAAFDIMISPSARSDELDDDARYDSPVLGDPAAPLAAADGQGSPEEYTYYAKVDKRDGANPTVRAFDTRPFRERQESTDPHHQRQIYEPQDLEIRGRVMLGYQASAVLGFGSVLCWMDNDREGGTTIDGWWEVKERNMGVVREVASGLSPGHHTLSCELLEHTLDPEGGTEFRIFAYMHD